MKISQSEGFKPVTITLETRGELAIVLASIGATSFHDRNSTIRDKFAEHIDDKYRDTGSELYEKLKQIFVDSKPKTSKSSGCSCNQTKSR